MAKVSKKTPSKKAIQRPYPQYALEKVLRVPFAIKEKNGGNPFDATDVASACKVSKTSANFFYLVSSAVRFGLVEKIGEKIALTPIGRDLVYSESKEQEQELKRKAFFSVDLYRRVFEHYKGCQLPEEIYLSNTLSKEFNLPEPLHVEFASLFKENCAYLQLDKIGDAAFALSKGSSEPDTAHSVVVGGPKKGSSLSCFVMMPFKERTEEYHPNFFREVLNSLITPAATEAGFEVRTANRQGTEMIHSTIINEILDADMVVCDLSEHNPNVLFELGIRLALEKPVALIHAEATERIFDVDNILRVHPYHPQLWRTTLETDIPALTAHIKATWEGRSTNETYMGALKKMKQGGNSSVAS